MHDAAKDAGPREALSTVVAKQLRDKIADGTWPVGSRIPTEPQLCVLLNTGRNTVREAVQSLVHVGLLSKRQGSGTYVIADDDLALALSRQVSRSAHHEALEVRRALEVEAARLAAVGRTEREMAVIHTLAERRRNAFADGDVEPMVLSDLSLHQAIVAAAHNALLLSMYENLVDAISSTIRTNVTATPTPPGTAAHDLEHDHDPLIAALAARNPHAAVQAIVDSYSLYLSAAPESSVQ